MSTIPKTTDKTFAHDVLQSETPVLVDFYADWCGPCKALAPTVEAIAAEYDGRITVKKIDVDNNQETTAEYGVSGIPSLILYKGGKEVRRFVGVLPARALKEGIESHLEPAHASS